MTKAELLKKIANEQESDLSTIKYYVNNCADIIKEIQDFMSSHFENLTELDRSCELYNLIGKLRNNQIFLTYAAISLKAHNQISN